MFPEKKQSQLIAECFKSKQTNETHWVLSFFFRLSRFRGLPLVFENQSLRTGVRLWVTCLEFVNSCSPLSSCLPAEEDRLRLKHNKLFQLERTGENGDLSWTTFVLMGFQGFKAESSKSAEGICWRPFFDCNNNCRYNFVLSSNSKCQFSSGLSSVHFLPC